MLHNFFFVFGLQIVVLIRLCSLEIFGCNGIAILRGNLLGIDGEFIDEAFLPGFFSTDIALASVDSCAKLEMEKLYIWAKPQFFNLLC